MSFLGKVTKENINFCGKKMIFYFYSSSMNKFRNFVLISKSCQNSCSSQRIKNILYSCQSLKKISSTAENSLQTESFLIEWCCIRGTAKCKNEKMVSC